jgi:transposase-like protein
MIKKKGDVMSRIRRNFTLEQKIKIVLEILKEEETLTQISSI